MRNPVFFLALWEGVKPKILLPQIFFQDQNRKMKSARCGLIRLQSAPSKLTNHFSIWILTDLIRWQTSFSVIWESKYWFKAIHYLTFVIRNVCISHNSTGIFYSFWITFIWSLTGMFQLICLAGKAIYKKKECHYRWYQPDQVGSVRVTGVFGL